MNKTDCIKTFGCVSERSDCPINSLKKVRLSSIDT